VDIVKETLMCILEKKLKVQYIFDKNKSHEESEGNASK
jgi:hypothetical protein